MSVSARSSFEACAPRWWGRAVAIERYEVDYTFLIAAGGTGGHVIPGLGVAEELRARGHRVVMVGTERGMETKLVPRAGFPLETIPVGALNRVSLTRKLRTLAELPRSIWQARVLLRKHQPSAVLSLGGYASGPLTLAAVLSAIPVIAMEPNAYPGLANRLASRWVRRALLGFEDAMRFFPSGRSEVVGVPVRKEFFELPRKQRAGSAVVLITGGSQGSRTLNRAVRDAARVWIEKGFPGGLQLVHQTGQAEYNEIRSEYEALPKSREVSVEAVPFFDDMPAAFARADLIISRAGASALAELAASGKASVLIPFPFAADDHQMRNARAMESSGAARVVADADWTGERMVREVGGVLGSPGRLQAMADAAHSLARAGAASRAADAMIEEAERAQQGKK
ncbi:MAG: undecaprenyldiphospho-muramoylpentapeptide beta-N-acetylglucosaminyltransferase [Acidobacteria bacterium]|nr:undecaprenyldiphospho-muramoylpentapeptide beta-N-acetylglucosaminyltransferase [Acidobacteriota bacterium]